MYMHTDCMPMPAFKRCIYYFMSVHNFRDWRTRFNWIKEHYSDKSITKDKMTAYYGKEEGIKRWKSYCEKQSYTNTFEYKHKKYGISEEEFLEYNKLRATTLENMISKYGVEKGTKRFNSYVEKQRDAGCSLKYFQEKYGDEEGKKYYERLNSQKAMTLTNFKRIYGDINGYKKYFEYKQNNKWYNKSSHYYSEIAVEMFSKIIEQLPKEIQNNIYYYKNEYRVISKSENVYYLDFYIDKINYAIEFYGNYWHLNPSMYKSDELVKFVGRGLIFPSEIWEKDRKRVDEIKDCGYILNIVWESDYRSNKNGVIKKYVADILNQWENRIDKNELLGS